MSNSAIGTKICSRCHTSTHLDNFDEGETICSSCLSVKPRITRKGCKKDVHKKYGIEPDEWKYCCIWNDAGLYL